MSDHAFSTATQNSTERATVTVIGGNSGKKIAVFTLRKGLNLWVFLRKQGIPIGASCSGVGVCGACRVQITQENSENLLEKQTDFERNSLLRQKIPDCYRLSCLYRVFEDVIVKIDPL